MSESKLEQKVVQHSTKVGGVAYKYSAQNRSIRPDRHCVKPNGRGLVDELAVARKDTTTRYKNISLKDCSEHCLQDQSLPQAFARKISCQRKDVDRG